MPSTLPKLTIRPREGQDGPWRAAAARAGVSLNEWMLQTLDEALGIAPGPGPEEPAEIATAPAPGRAHMKRDRPAVQCPSRVLADGVCPECGYTADD